MDTHIHTNTVKEAAQNFKLVRFLISCRVSSLCFKTFDDKWPTTHLKWESSQRNAIIDSFFTKQLNRKKFPPDRTADQTQSPAKDICSRHHNCHCCLWLIHEQYVVWAVGPCCRGKIEQQDTAHCCSCFVWWLFGSVWVFSYLLWKNRRNKTARVFSHM